ncbi:MAG TPA: integrase core domain-containing protein [Candidatus Eisenbacteria bacterium]|nr:integrase core domain-containing protein [Candidatus Eisenbacteria bacterium]
MIRALLLIAREIALAHDQWLANLGRRRPLAAENAALREIVERQRAQIDLLRARLLGHGAPSHVVTDHGRQFTSAAFKCALARRRIRHRFGAVAKRGSRSLARIDRFWRSMKDEYARGLFLYRPLRAIERDMVWYVSWFNEERPHGGLDLRTPDDVHHERRRRRPRNVTRGVLAVRFVAGDHRLPILRLRRAA